MKNKRTQGLGNKYLLSFPMNDSMNWSVKTRKQCQKSCQYNIMHVNQSIRVTIFVIFRFVRRQVLSPKKLHVQTTWNFRRQKIAQAVIQPLTEMVKDNWMVSFYKVFLPARDGLKYFLSLFNGWVSNIFTKKNISLQCDPYGGPYVGMWLRSVDSVLMG
jgi:hypothetical protein